jgi:hypothetical protein
MSDLFVSYASADRDRAKVVADVLAEQGWSVWWDRTIPPGKQFDEVIEQALDDAKCVVVLWSAASVASTWVKTEAAEAMRRKILIPALIDGVKIPLEFRRLQAADLSNWQGDRSDPELVKFFQSIAVELGRPPSPQPEPAPVKEREPPPPRPVIKPARRQSDEDLPPPPQRKPGRMAVWLGGALAVVVVAVAYSSYVERTTRLALEEKLAEERIDMERSRQQDAAANAARENIERAAAQERQQKFGASPASVNIVWRDHAIHYSGTLRINAGSAIMSATLTDIGSGARIGKYDVPARITRVGSGEIVASSDFAIAGDSVTPYPHTHTSYLTLHMQQDGTPVFVNNCPKPGECYAGE